MAKNTGDILTQTSNLLKRLLIYHPPIEPKPFVLQESEDIEERPPSLLNQRLPESLAELDTLLRYARRLANAMEEVIQPLSSAQIEKSLSVIKNLCQALDKQQSEISPLLISYDKEPSGSATPSVSASLEENEKAIGDIYRLPSNSDLTIRKFLIPAEPSLQAMIIYMEGLCDTKIVNNLVLKPLMLYCRSVLLPGDSHLVQHLVNQYLPHSKATISTSFAAINDALNSGDAALFLEGEAAAVLIEGKGWEHRSVERPVFEQTVRGSQTGFGEVLGVNTALVRSLLSNSDLVTEKIPVGMKTKTTCVVMYLESVANPVLVQEIKRRIKGIKTDYITDISILEQFISDHPNLPFPTSINTERPDRVAAGLNEGRVALLLDSSPFALVMPISLFSLMHSAEDFTMLQPYGSVVRLIRWTGTLMALLLPALFLAISTFHQEAIPTEMLLAITSARLQVPFPTIAEMLLLGVAFELIREGGMRIPGFLGPTIGIVGGIILGQAAVSAKVVSPIMVIVVAATGVASYTIPDFRMGAAIRLTSLIFVLFSALMGIVGIATGIMILSAILCSMKSYGMPYVSPVAPRNNSGIDVIIRGPVFRQEMRPDALNPKIRRRQPHISRLWKTQKADGGKE